jgi:hypothetical protein
VMPGMAPFQHPSSPYFPFPYPHFYPPFAYPQQQMPAQSVITRAESLRRSIANLMKGQQI